ncbi:unnamed protein product, partial [Urochloa humidicola]
CLQRYPLKSPVSLVCSVLAAAAHALLQLRPPTSSARHRAPPFPCTAPRAAYPAKPPPPSIRLAAAADSPSAESRSTLSPPRRWPRLSSSSPAAAPSLLPTPAATPFRCFLAGGHTPRTKTVQA